jgi:hypothetical protein
MDEPRPGPDGDGRPPDDPDDWTDEQWLAWLSDTDQAAVEDGTPPPRPARRVARSAGGVLGNAMVGVANAIYGVRDTEVVIVQEAGEPEDDGFDVKLDPDHPERSVVVRRPPRH